MGGVIKDKVHSSGYVSVGQGQPPVESSPQPQSGEGEGEGEYEVPSLQKQFPAVPTLSPPAVAPSQDKETGTQEEAVYD